MGRFFNEVISKMTVFPMNRTGRKGSLEELRIKFNEEQKSPEDTIREKRLANLAKAREAKKRKANA